MHFVALCPIQSFLRLFRLQKHTEDQRSNVKVLLRWAGSTSHQRLGIFTISGQSAAKTWLLLMLDRAIEVPVPQPGFRGPRGNILTGPSRYRTHDCSKSERHNR